MILKSKTPRIDTVEIYIWTMNECIKYMYLYYLIGVARTRHLYIIRVLGHLLIMLRKKEMNRSRNIIITTVVSAIINEVKEM